MPHVLRTKLTIIQRITLGLNRSFFITSRLRQTSAAGTYPTICPGMMIALADRRQASHVLAKISESSFDIANELTLWEQSLLSRQQQQSPRSDDRERITGARQTAEALFTSKPPAGTSAVPDAPPAEQSAHKPRVLPIISPPTPVQHDESETPAVPAPPVREIPRSQFARIRAWVKYGMTIAQVAQVYSVAVGEIERILRHT